MIFYRRCSQQSAVQHAAAGIVMLIGIEYFAPLSTAWYTNGIVMPHHGCEIANDDEKIFAPFCLALEDDHAVFAVTIVYPLEAFLLE